MFSQRRLSSQSYVLRPCCDLPIQIADPTTAMSVTCCSSQCTGMEFKMLCCIQDRWCGRSTSVMTLKISVDKLHFDNKISKTSLSGHLPIWVMEICKMLINIRSEIHTWFILRDQTTRRGRIHFPTSCSRAISSQRKKITYRRNIHSRNIPQEN